MKNILALLVLLLIPLVARSEPVRIGILTDLSGGMASWGKQTRIGAELAQEEIRAAGGEVSLFFGDHQLQAKNAVSEFQKLMDANEIEAVYSEFAPTSIAISATASSRKIPMIYAAAATSPLNISPYSFKTYLDYAEGCRITGLYWKSLGIKKVGVLKPTLEFGERCSEGFNKIYPDAYEITYNSGDEVKSQVLLLKSKGVEAVMNATFEPDFLRMLKSFKDLNWKPLSASDQDAVADQVRLNYADYLEKITIFALPTISQDLIEKIKNREPGGSSVSIEAAGLALVHIKQLYSAVSACSPRTVECVTSNLSKAEKNGDIGFSGWSDRVARFKTTLRSWRSGKEIELDE